MMISRAHDDPELMLSQDLQRDSKKILAVPQLFSAWSGRFVCELRKRANYLRDAATDTCAQRFSGEREAREARSRLFRPGEKWQIIVAGSKRLRLGSRVHYFGKNKAIWLMKL